MSKVPSPHELHVEDGSRALEVATTRPETMFGMAVAVNPEDPRYKDLIGKTSFQSLINPIPIVGDEHADLSLVLVS